MALGSEVSLYRDSGMDEEFRDLKTISYKDSLAPFSLIINFLNNFKVAVSRDCLAIFL